MFLEYVTPEGVTVRYHVSSKGLLNSWDALLQRQWIESGYAARKDFVRELMDAIGHFQVARDDAPLMPIGLAVCERYVANLSPGLRSRLLLAWTPSGFSVEAYKRAVSILTHSYE